MRTSRQSKDWNKLSRNKNCSVRVLGNLGRRVNENGLERGTQFDIQPKFSAYLFNVQSSSCKYESDKSVSAAQ
jgi:hypothetical protein